MAYSLPDPSANDRTVSFSIPKEVDPLYVVWFNSEKNDSESVNDFLIRILNEKVLIFTMQKELDIVDSQAAADRLTESDNIADILKTNLT